MEAPEMFETQEPFSLSLELVRFMRWMAYHDPESLRKMITKAVHHMPDPTTFLTDTTEEREDHDIQKDITTFLSLMETFIQDALNEHQSKIPIRNQMIPAVARIDSDAVDSTLVQNSVERAANQMRLKPHENPRDLLIQELLKKWDPHHEPMH